MYFYIYDSFLSDKKFERDLALVETRLTDLGISGKIGRLTPFVSARGLIRDEARRGARTVVVVGNDETVSKAVEGIGEEKVALGIIPVGAPTYIADSLGIPYGVDACDVLSKRMTRKIDLGTVNGRLFLSDVRIPRGKVTIEGEGRFRVSSITAECQVIVSNLRNPEMAGADFAVSTPPGDPQDGFLDALIAPVSGRLLGLFGRKSARACSVIPLRKLAIRSERPVSILADGRRFTNNSVLIEVVPDRLKVITGRERVFA